MERMKREIPKHCNDLDRIRALENENKRLEEENKKLKEEIENHKQNIMQDELEIIPKLEEEIKKLKEIIRQLLWRFLHRNIANIEYEGEEIELGE